MEKILLLKTDTPEIVILKLEALPEAECTVVIPKEAVFSESIANFRLLKREVDTRKKKVVIESVDETALALAQAAGLEAIHPFFAKREESRAFSDIVPAVPVPKSRSPRRTRKLEVNPVTGSRPGLPSNEVNALPRKPMKESEPAKESLEPPPPLWVVRAQEEKPVEDAAPPAERRRIRTPSRRVLLALLMFAVLGGGAWTASVTLGRAEVVLNFNKVPWEYQGNLVASKTVAALEVAARRIPGEVFYEEKNISKLFLASGRAQVSQKATGRITIYNAYSSEPQILVATTRFTTPDGKIFRLDDQVLVPGAEIKDGKIAASRVDANVTADKAGPAANVGPTEKLVIPGFKGTPRYNGFYGAFEKGTSGGFVGERAVPTDADIASAKEKTTEILRSALESNLLQNQPEGFVVLKDASEIVITKLTVNKDTDADGNFSVFGAAQFRAIGFREADLNEMLLVLAKEVYPDRIFGEFTLAYQDPKADFERGEMAVGLKAQGVLRPAFELEAFRETLLGKDLASSRALILSLANITDAKISLWPFWLTRIPENSSRVQIMVD